LLSAWALGPAGRVIYGGYALAACLRAVRDFGLIKRIDTGWQKISLRLYPVFKALLSGDCRSCNGSVSELVIPKVLGERNPKQCGWSGIYLLNSRRCYSF